jgi:NAD(P)H dehydrogenase (quinone)
VTRRLLIATAHPDPESLTVTIATRLAHTAQAAGDSATIDNLAARGFEPAYTPQDLTDWRMFVETHEIAAFERYAEEHQSIAEATDLVLVFPVHWWSFPAQLKGWVDRVFTGGFAWGARRLGRETTELAHLRAHVIAITGSSAATFAVNGWDEALYAQIDRGILKYCGIPETTWSWIWDPAREPPGETEAAIAAAIGAVLGD